MKKAYVDQAILMETFSQFVDAYEKSNDEQRLALFARIMPLLKLVRDTLKDQVEELAVRQTMEKDEVMRQLADAAATATLASRPQEAALAVAVMKTRARQIRARA